MKAIWLIAGLGVFYLHHIGVLPLIIALPLALVVGTALAKPDKKKGDE